jgi:hypothetical protein
MTLDLTARRALLRDAVTGDSGVEAFRAPFDGAGEEDRARLAKTLPPTRLFTKEGPTPRACYVLAALARPKAAAETLLGVGLAGKDDHSRMAPAVIEAAAARDADWRAEFVELLADQPGWGGGLVWPVCRALVHDHGVTPNSVAYLRCFLQQVTAVGGDQRDGRGDDERGHLMAEYLMAHPEFVETEFWALFRVEGMGANRFLTEFDGPAWDATLRGLGRADPGFRDRLLDESVNALLRDFSTRNIAWYVRAHRLADPTPSEVAGRQDRYVAVLTTTPSTAVGLAQEMLRRAPGAIDADALIAASNAVLTRTEKKLVKAQLSLLAELSATDGHRQAISDLVAGVIDSLAPELVPTARKLVIGTIEPATVEAGEPVAVPDPRRRALPGDIVKSDPISNDDTLFSLVSEHLEGVGDGADLPRILSYLAEHPESTAPDALRARAPEVVRSVWDKYEASPRRHLAAIVAEDAAAPEFRGYSRFVVLGPGEPVPEGAVVEKTHHTTSTFDPKTGGWHESEGQPVRAGHQHQPTDAPLGLLAETMRNVRLARGARLGRHEGKLRLGRRDGWLGLRRRESPRVELPVPIPALTRTWERVVAAPGRGTHRRDLDVLGDEPRAFWRVVADDRPPNARDDIAHRALNVAPVADEFTFRAQEAREQDGADQIVQWAAWLLQRNPDTLAAHFHPALYAATHVVNVRGLAPLLAALGASRQVPAAPVYSALALAGSAKEAHHRAQAAEAIAALAGSGLLDPAPFAAEMTAHLADRFVMAGRLATTLEDAASISAIAGYRVLQTLAAVLPRLGGVHQSGKLVELTARLAADYGTPVAVPAALADKRPGNSAQAVALSALDAVVPRPTRLAQDAAAQASSARNSPAEPG